MSSYLPTLPIADEREGVGRELQTVLVALVELSLIGKRLHWAVYRPRFTSLRFQLDELVNSWWKLADTVAERAVALGFVPDAQAHAVAAASQLAPVPRGPIEDRVVVREITRRLADLSERVRSRLDAVGQADLTSQDVLIEVLGELEKQQWMLRVQLGARA